VIEHSAYFLTTMKKSSSKSAKKVATEAIPNDRNRQITFSKRKWGLLKKAYELSTLCDCQIGLVIFSNNNKVLRCGREKQER